MPSFASPIWLIGLVVIPLIWWLHRLGDPGEATPVSAAFLFHIRADEMKPSRASPKTNPLWILRAILLSLLVLALTRPYWSQNPERNITVWFDDSLSMRTVEGGSTRTAIALQELSTALDEVHPANVKIRILGDHREPFDASALEGGSRSDAIGHWVDLHTPGNPLIPFDLPRESENWLVWDGADQIVNDWISDAGFSRTITVGSLTENTAITAIMARRTLQQATLHHGSVRVDNLGVEDSKRTLIVRADGEPILTEDIEITPRGNAYRSFRIPADTAVVTATLLPPDALAQDDTLEIILDSLRPVVVDLDSRCGPRFSAALKTHPGLKLHAGSGQKPELTVRCKPSPGPLASPSISLHTGIDYEAVKGRVQWHQPVQGLDGIFLEGSWLLISPTSARLPSDHTLLSAPDINLSLIDMHAGAVDIFMDLESAPIVERLEYPLLINALVEFALARPVLDPVVHAARNAAESRVARQSETVITASPVARAQVRTDLAPYLLTLAMLLLLADVLISLPAGVLDRRASRSTA